MGKQIRADRLPFNSFEFVENGAAIRFGAEGQRWTCDLSSYKCRKEKLPSVNEEVSPDRNSVAFVKDYNLYVRDRLHEQGGES